MPQAPSRADLCLGQRACSGLSGAGVTRGPAAPGALRVFCQRQTGPRASSPGSQGPPPLSWSGPLPLPGGLAAIHRTTFCRSLLRWGHTASPAHAASLSR